MHWPNGITAPGRTYDELVSHIDFVPTLLELAGESYFNKAGDNSQNGNPGGAVDGGQ
jgi:arylsulfatase A-like enzyme